MIAYTTHISVGTAREMYGNQNLRGLPSAAWLPTCLELTQYVSSHEEVRWGVWLNWTRRYEPLWSASISQVPRGSASYALRTLHTMCRKLHIDDARWRAEHTGKP